MKTFLTTALLLMGLAGAVSAETELFKRFKDAHGEVGSELSTKPPAELAEVKDFVYKKDVATFTFKSGKIYLLRKIEGRPITAIFLGEGHASIEIPSHVERQSLWYASGDSTVDESFEVAFINFSDDFDLKLREQFTFEETSLPWRDFNQAQQGEFFFKPVVMHEYDNYFQLLRSLFERKDDGYFWIDFNRYNFSFDPNRPEEVIVAYEHEGGDIEVASGAVLPRMEKKVYDGYALSHPVYPTTMISRRAELKMVGLDGKNLERADVRLQIRVEADSLQWLSLFLHHNLKIDSVFYNGEPVDYWRRGSFTFMGIILPEHRYAGDTLDLRLVYHGTEYASFLPFIENPAPTPHELVFDIHKGYNYVMPAMSPVEEVERGRERFRSEPAEPYRMFRFQPYASGFDTVNVISDIGLTVSFLQAGHIDKNHFSCFIPHEQYQAGVMQAFNFMTSRLGMPLATFSMAVYPEPTASMPGLMGISQTDCHADGTGGLVMAAGDAAARQYFGSLMQPASEREFWLADAVPDYLSLMTVWHEVSPPVFFGELGRRRHHILSLLDNDEDRPLATGRRAPTTDRISKGSWVMHMLRFLMYDLESRSDAKFWAFINDLKTRVNSDLFTNEDVVQLAEKHYGGDLGWFFKHWLFERYIPEYNVEYRIEKRDAGHYVVANVKTEKVPADFKFPVIFRVESEGGQSVYLRQMIEGNADTFELGPFSFKPKELVFNEFHSVLCKDKVKKK